MLSAFMRSLTLISGLILALPPGWCCMVRIGGPAQEAAGETPSPTCCEHCKAPQRPKAPASTPVAPLPPGKCPCTGRQTTLPDAPKVIACDLSLPTPVAVIDLVPASPVAAGHDRLPDPSSDLSLHLLHRVWLC